MKVLFAAYTSPLFLLMSIFQLCLDELTEPEEPLQNSLDVFPNFRAVIP